jgi:hypothetical protein
VGVSSESDGKQRLDALRRPLLLVGEAMKNTLNLVTIVGACALPILACSANNNQSGDFGDAADQGSEQDLTAAKGQLKGSWTIDPASQSLTPTLAYEFRPDGTFWRDDGKVLNGLAVKGDPAPARTTGHYVVNTRKRALTLHLDSGDVEVLLYNYAGRVLNGVFLPGPLQSAPEAHLTLVEQAPPMSNIQFPALKFDHASSYCVSDADCDAERADKTWTPGGSGASQCDAASRACTVAGGGVTTCNDLSPCPAGLVCNSVNGGEGTCVAPGQSCNDLAPCPAGFACSASDGAEGVCVAK